MIIPLIFCFEFLSWIFNFWPGIRETFSAANKFIYLSISPSIYLYVYLSVYISPSISLSIYLSINVCLMTGPNKTLLWFREIFCCLQHAGGSAGYMAIVCLLFGAFRLYDREGSRGQGRHFSTSKKNCIINFMFENDKQFM